MSLSQISFLLLWLAFGIAAHFLLHMLPDKKPSDFADKIFSFIEHPLVITALFTLGGLVGAVLFTPAFVLCAAAIVLGFHRSKLVAGQSRGIQIFVWVVLLMVMVIGGYFVTEAMDEKLAKIQRDFAEMVASYLSEKTKKVPMPLTEKPQQAADKKDPAFSPDTGREKAKITRPPDGRKILDWQKQLLLKNWEQLKGKKVTIVANSGSETWFYANDFKEILRKIHCKVTGPIPAPQSVMIETNIYISSRYFGNPANSESEAPGVFIAQLLKNNLELVRIPVRSNFLTDSDLELDEAALWIGPQGPEGLNPGVLQPSSLRVKGRTKRHPEP